MEPPAFPLEIYSVIRLRVTDLKGEPDAWYQLNSNSRFEYLKLQLRNDIVQVIFPHFEKMNSIENVIN